MSIYASDYFEIANLLLDDKIQKQQIKNVSVISNHENLDDKKRKLRNERERGRSQRLSSLMVELSHVIEETKLRDNINHAIEINDIEFLMNNISYITCWDNNHRFHSTLVSVRKYLGVDSSFRKWDYEVEKKKTKKKDVLSDALEIINREMNLNKKLKKELENLEEKKNQFLLEESFKKSKRQRIF